MAALTHNPPLQVGDEQSREQLIKSHYMGRIGELTTQLQVSDSKAVHFNAEVRGGCQLPRACAAEHRGRQGQTQMRPYDSHSFHEQ